MSNLMRNILDGLTLHRRDDTGQLPPLRPRGEGEGPKSGIYWTRANAVVPITGTCNDAVFLSGQAVLLNPPAFGLTIDDILGWLALHDTASPVSEYIQFLSGTPCVSPPATLFYLSSRLVYQGMLRTGWAWVSYDAPARVRIAVHPTFAKRQVACIADQFSLIQVDRISITLINSIENLNDKQPHLSGNCTLTFSRDDFDGFAGPFGAVLDWLNGKDAPPSNYLYYLAPDLKGIPAALTNVKTVNGIRKRWAVCFHAKPPALMPQNRILCRVPVSVIHTLPKTSERGLTNANQRGHRMIFSDQPFRIPAGLIEHYEDGQWLSLA